MSNVPNASIPTVHLNGSSPDSLLDAYREVLDVCLKLAKALAEAQPNGRDFYPQGPNAISVAMAEHRTRVERVKLTMDEITALYDGVMDQVEARQKR